MLEQDCELATTELVTRLTFVGEKDDAGKRERVQ